MLIRDAKSEDAYRIAVIRIDSWRVEYRGIMPDAVLDGLSIDEQHKFWLAGVQPLSNATKAFISATMAARKPPAVALRRIIDQALVHHGLVTIEDHE